MAHGLHIHVQCPHCGKALMTPEPKIDQLDSIHFLVKIGNRIGHLYLSQVYGSYEKIFENVEDLPDAVVECSCPLCYRPFPVHQACGSCGAAVIGLDLKVVLQVDALGHPDLAVERTARQVADLGVHLGGGVHRVAFEVLLAGAAVDDDELGGLAFGPGRVPGFEDAAEIGRDRDPSFPVHLLVELASEPSNHCPEVPFAVLVMKTADRAAATARSAALVPSPG